MNAQKFTQKSLEAIQEAQNIALEHNSMQIEQEHLLLALLETANDKGEALALPGIQDRADRFAENMLCQLAY